MTTRIRKPLIALIVAAGSVLAIPAMAQSAQHSARIGVGVEEESTGEIERTSTTSQLVPSDSARAAAWSSVVTMAPCPTRVTSVPVRTTREECSGTAGASSSTSPFGQYRLFGSRKITGSSDAMASWIIQ